MNHLGNPEREDRFGASRSALDLFDLRAQGLDGGSGRKLLVDLQE